MGVDGQDSTFSDIFTKLNLLVPQVSLYILFSNITFYEPGAWSSCIKVFMSTFVEYLVREVGMLVENVRQEGLKFCQHYIMLSFFRCRYGPVTFTIFFFSFLIESFANT